MSNSGGTVCKSGAETLWLFGITQMVMQQMVLWDAEMLMQQPDSGTSTMWYSLRGGGSSRCLAQHQRLGIRGILTISRMLMDRDRGCCTKFLGDDLRLRAFLRICLRSQLLQRLRASTATLWLRPALQLPRLYGA